MSGRPTPFTVVVSPRIPPEDLPGLRVAVLPERTLGGVRVWCWPWVPTEAMGWTVGTRGTLHRGMVQDLPTRDWSRALTPAWQAREVLLKTAILLLKPDAWDKAGPASIPWLAGAQQVVSGGRG